VIGLDSIDYCNTHYSISFITANDTFKTVIRKDNIQQGAVLIGNSFDIGLAVLDSMIIGTKYGEYKFKDNIRAQVSHPSNDTYDETKFAWKIDGALWWKKYFELRLSTYYSSEDNMGYHFVVEKLKRKKAHNNM
jgi:hypothetical protein